MEIKSKRLHLHTNQGLNTMKEIKLEINIEARKYNELTEEDRKLVDAACKATQRSYAPYSHFSVGAAALLENGVVLRQEDPWLGLTKALTAVFLPSGEVHYPILCQFPISRPSGKNTCHCCTNRTRLP